MFTPAIALLASAIRLAALKRPLRTSMDNFLDFITRLGGRGSCMRKVVCEVDDYGTLVRWLIRFSSFPCFVVANPVSDKHRFLLERGVGSGTGLGGGVRGAARELSLKLTIEIFGGI